MKVEWEKREEFGSELVKEKLKKKILLFEFLKWNIF